MASSLTRRAWEVGNVAAVPLSDGTFGLAQVVSLEPGIKKAVTIVYFDVRLTTDQLRHVVAPPTPDHVVSIQFTERRALTQGLWRVLCSAPVNLAGISIPFENTRSSGWVGARFYYSGSITLFLQAFFGIQSWDLMLEFFDALLLHPGLKPKGRGVAG